MTQLGLARDFINKFLAVQVLELLAIKSHPEIDRKDAHLLAGIDESLVDALDVRKEFGDGEIVVFSGMQLQKQQINFHGQFPRFRLFKE